MIRVLVVGDDFMVARIHARYVTWIPGFEVVGMAHTGKAALEQAKTAGPDLILLDIYLPGMSGIDVFRELRWRAGQANLTMRYGGAGRPEHRYRWVGP
jgi:response regulator of citrate/malate metabolism